MNPLSQPRVALIGFGALGSQIARGIAAGVAGNYRITAVLVRSKLSKADTMMRAAGARVCAALGELIETRPDYVVEAASADALRQMAVPCLRAKAHLIVLSTGAFSDESFLKAAIAAAVENDRKIYVASGAIGGLDLVQPAFLGDQGQQPSGEQTEPARSGLLQLASVAF